MKAKAVFVSRRDFLKFIAATGLCIGVSRNGMTAILEKKAFEKTPGFSPNAWLHIDSESIVTIYCSQCEIGQGVFTVLPAIVADELDADWKRVRIRQAPIATEYEDPVWESQVTAGSASVHHFYDILRKAGAQARKMLVAAAARRWQVPVGEIVTSKAKVIHKPSGRWLCYGDIALAASREEFPAKVTLKKEREFKLIGRPLHRVDALSKINGSATFGLDVRLRGLSYCVMKRPPRYGAVPRYVEKKDAYHISGVTKIFRVDDKVALVATSPQSCIRARDRLKVKWHGGEDPGLDDKKIERVILSGLERPGRVHTIRGDIKKAESSSFMTHEATYLLPYLAHATMEPMNCTAHVDREKCMLWAPSQNQSAVLQAAREETGLPTEKIHIETPFMGGSFGRRYEVDFVRECLQVAKKVKGPVKLFWTRDDDFSQDFFRPANSARIRAGIDKDGRISFWKHKVSAPSVYWRIEPDLLDDGIDPSAVESIHNSAYSFPSLHLEYVWIKELAPPLGFWRSVGNSHNCFTVESFMDELAHKAGMDPVEFRLKNLKDHPRAARVVEVAAEKAHWEKGAKIGQGLGVSQHYLVYTYIATVAEVSVDEKTGTVKVHRVVCAVDCGKAVNPRVVKEQIEGGILFGLSAALKEKVSFSKGGVVTTGFADYSILTMSETPEVEVYVVDSGNPPTGVGEVGTAPIAPAVSNAIFHATGVRIRRLPLVAERVLRHLSEKG